jgi:hypothetical protein
MAPKPRGVTLSPEIPKDLVCIQILTAFLLFMDERAPPVAVA